MEKWTKWNWTNNKFIVTPFFGTVMSEYRFSPIMKNLYFTNNKEFDEPTCSALKLKNICDMYQLIMKNLQTEAVGHGKQAASIPCWFCLALKMKERSRLVTTSNCSRSYPLQLRIPFTVCGIMQMQKDNSMCGTVNNLLHHGGGLL